MTHFLITRDEDLIDFHRSYERLAKLPVDEGYLRSAAVIGFRNSTGEIIGGYALHEGAPRCYSFFADESLRSEWETTFPSNQTLEVTCLWMSPSLTSLAARVFIYMHMYFDVRSRRPSFLVSGSAIPTLQRLHTMMLTEKKWNGAWSGTNKAGLVYGGSTRKLGIRFLRALTFYVLYKARSKTGSLVRKGKGAGGVARHA